VLLDIEEGRKAITPEEFMVEIRKKWKANLKMTNELLPATQQVSRISPFKSMQTDITSYPHTFPSNEEEPIYFGFDREWTY
jgi:hypothetical protein